jgi:hypothetical protein
LIVVLGRMMQYSLLTQHKTNPKSQPPVHVERKGWRRGLAPLHTWWGLVRPFHQHVAPHHAAVCIAHYAALACGCAVGVSMHITAGYTPIQTTGSLIALLGVSTPVIANVVAHTPLHWLLSTFHLSDRRKLYVTRGLTTLNIERTGCRFGACTVVPVFSYPGGDGTATVPPSSASGSTAYYAGGRYGPRGSTAQTDASASSDGVVFSPAENRRQVRIANGELSPIGEVATNTTGADRYLQVPNPGQRRGRRHGAGDNGSSSSGSDGYNYTSNPEGYGNAAQNAQVPFGAETGGSGPDAPRHLTAAERVLAAHAPGSGSGDAAAAAATAAGNKPSGADACTIVDVPMRPAGAAFNLRRPSLKASAATLRRVLCYRWHAAAMAYAALLVVGTTVVVAILAATWCRADHIAFAASLGTAIAVDAIVMQVLWVGAVCLYRWVRSDDDAAAAEGREPTTYHEPYPAHRAWCNLKAR